MAVPVTRSAAPPAARCLDDQALLRLAGHEASVEQAALSHAHLDECATCMAAMLALVRSESTAAAEITHLGRFELRDQLGSGSMGTVYTAWDPQLDRLVAIKVLRAGRAHPRDAERLVREARAMAQVRHPNVVTVYEVGQDRDVVFVAMERITGPTLRTAAAAGASPARAVTWLAQIANGLAAIHRAGLAHRDIKPDNVFVENDRALIGDFGLATTTRAELGADGDGGAVVASRRAGTPAYMAPEQLRGEAADVLTDLFGFAVTAWEVLAGARPFAGATVDELARAMAAGPPAPLAIPGLAPAVAGLLARCLHPDRGQRPPSMAPVVDALDAVVAPATPRAGRRRRLAVGLAVGAVASAAVIVGAGGLGEHARGPRPAQCQLDRTTRMHEREAWTARAEGLSPLARGGITAILARRDRDWATAATRACAGDVVAQAAWVGCQARVEHQEQVLLALAVERRWPDERPLVRAFEGLEAPAACDSREAAEEAVDLTRLAAPARAAMITGQGHLVRARALASLDAGAAVDAALAAAREQATVAGSAALDAEIALATAELRPPTTAIAQQAALQAVAAAAERTGRASLIARAWLALVTHAAEFELDPAAVATAIAQAEWAIDRLERPARLRVPWLVLRAEDAWSRGDHGAARRLLVEAMTLAGRDPYLAATRDQAIARIAFLGGDDVQAAAVYRELLADPDLASVLAARERVRLQALLAECLYRLDDLEPAAQAIDAALAEGARAFPPDDPMQTTNQVIAASIRYERGDAAGALATLTAARAAADRALGADNVVASHIEMRRAQIFLDQGQRAPAVAALREGLRISDQRYGRHSELGVIGRGMMAEALVASGDVAAALPIFNEADDDGRAVYGNDHPMWAQSVPPYAAALVQVGRRDEARQRLEAALAVMERTAFAPDITAEARFALAELIDRTDRVRARALASQALADASADERPTITAWLRARGGIPR